MTGEMRNAFSASRPRKGQARRLAGMVLAVSCTTLGRPRPTTARPTSAGSSGGTTWSASSARGEERGIPSRQDWEKQLLGVVAMFIAAELRRFTRPGARVFPYHRQVLLEGWHPQDGVLGAYEYLLELALVDVRTIRFAPSMLVAAALLLSNELLAMQPSWPAAMAHHARRAEASLQACKEELRSLLAAAPRASLLTVLRKYETEQRHAVANMSVISCLK